MRSSNISMNSLNKISPLLADWLPNTMANASVGFANPITNASRTTGSLLLIRTLLPCKLPAEAMPGWDIVITMLSTGVKPASF